jgi:cell wall-associated NlpC family hydrolase
MPTSLRSRLLALALVAIVFGSAAAIGLASPDKAAVKAKSAKAASVARLKPKHKSKPKPKHKRRAHKKRAHRKPSKLGERAARIAVKAVGIPYRWGGSSPSGGFDCSGLVRWAYGRLGVSLPHSSYALYGIGRRVPRSRLRAGDLLFFNGLGHVGLYLGRGRMVHAPRSGRNVEVVGLGGSYYGRGLVGARRVLRHAT